MSVDAKKHQPSRLFLLPKSDLDLDLQEFLIDREARNLAPKTLRWYTQSLAILRSFLRSQNVKSTADVTAPILRRFLLHLKERGHNLGGVRNIYGAVKAFLNWYAEENVPADWSNPLRKVKTPRTPELVLEPVKLDDLRNMLGQCKRRTFHGDRYRDLLLLLLDTGVRHQELTDLGTC